MDCWLIGNQRFILITRGGFYKQAGSSRAYPDLAKFFPLPSTIYPFSYRIPKISNEASKIAAHSAMAPVGQERDRRPPLP